MRSIAIYYKDHLPLNGKSDMSSRSALLKLCTDLQSMEEIDHFKIFLHHIYA